MVAADVEALAHEYCQQGVPVEFTEYQNLDHEEAIAPFESGALSFLQARFSGSAPINGCASIGAGNSLAPLTVPSAPAAPGSPTAACPLATGKLKGNTLGMVRLGMTRARVRRAYTRSSDHRGRYQDFFCLIPTGVRVGFPSPKLLRALPRGKRKAFRGRASWASTSNVYYAVKGVRVGMKLKAARKLLKLEKPFHIGRTYWYLAPNGKSTAVLKVRRGIIEEIGIADRQFTRTRAADRVFLKSFE